MVVWTSNLAGNRLKKTLKPKLSHNMQPKKSCVGQKLSRWIGKNGQKWAKMGKNEPKMVGNPCRNFFFKKDAHGMGDHAELFVR